MVSIDKLDKEILFELAKNAKISYIELSKNLKVSKNIISYRIKKLFENNYILSVIPILDFSVLGYNVFRLQLKFRNINETKKNKIIEEFKKFVHISWIVKLQGTWDLGLLFYTKNTQSFIDIYEKILEKYSQLIADKLFTIVKSITHLSPNYLVENKERVFLTTGNSKKEKTLEELEKTILRELLKDGSKNLVELSLVLNTPINTIKYNLTKLKKSGLILGFKAVLNLEKLSFEHFKIVLELENLTEKSQVNNFLKQQPNVVYITESIGKYDIEFEADFKETKDILNLINLIKSKFMVKYFEIIYENKEILINSIPF